MPNFSEMLQKKTLRQEILTKRKKLLAQGVTVKSKIIENNLIKFLEEKDFKYFLIYLPVNNEVLTTDIIDYLVKSKKKVYLPAFLKQDVWIISEFKNFNDLEPGPFNIYQPKNPRLVDLELIQAAILPGVAFDKKGVRLGYGKGVYDKLLAGFGGLKIGLAYDFQIVDAISAESHDLIVDMVVGENSIISNIT